MTNKSGILLCFFLVVAAELFGTVWKPKPKKKDLWQSWQTVTRNVATSPKPILIDIYTGWCHYCKLMDAETYANDSVYQYLKQHFYRYKFNAETKDTIEWQGKEFTFNLRYDVHDFPVYLTKGSIVYPTTVIIAANGQPYYQFGELKPAEMELLLKYYTEGIKTGISLEDYAKAFVASWK